MRGLCSCCLEQHSGWRYGAVAVRNCSRWERLGTKKERRREPPLRVGVLELRLRRTADPPRPSQLRPVPQDSAPGPRSRTLYVRLIYRRLSAFQLPGPAPVPLPVSGACAPSSWWVLPAVAFRTPVRPRPEPPSNPTFPSLSCVRSSSLLRPEPPGVYLKGSRIPIESPLMVRPAYAEPGLGDMLRTTGAFGPLSVSLHLPFGGSAVRPAGFI